MFFEFRQYTIKEGRRKDWVKLMEDRIIPYQISKGMIVIGSFVDEEDKNTYYWIRRFKNESQREKLYKAVYQSPEWTDVLKPLVDTMLIRKKIVVKRIVPTPKSVLQ